MLYNKIVPFGFILTAAAQSVVDVIAKNPNTSSLNKLLQGQPAVVSALKKADNITVLAPSNAAFDEFLKSDEGAAAASSPDVLANLLTYHVLDGKYEASDFSHIPKFPSTLLTNSSYTSLKDGQVVKVQTANSSVIIYSGLLSKSRVTTPDIVASNGIIHIIDTVLTIPVTISQTAKAAHLEELVEALEKADLVDTVDGLPSATVFAPFDQAFSKAADSLSKLKKDQLKKVLTYHVADKVEYSVELTDGSDVENINGKNIQINNKDYSIKVDSASVLSADVLVCNGVVYVIDQVLALKDGTDRDSKDKHDHDDHDHSDHDHHNAAEVGIKISKHGVIALGTFILAQLFAL